MHSTKSANCKTQKPVSFFDVVDDFFKVANTIEQKAKTQLYDSRLKANVSEVDNGYQITMAMPGVSKDMVTLDVKEQTLVVSINKETDQEESLKEYSLREFDYTASSRSFQLSKSIDMESIKAEMKDGLLTIEMSKKPAFIPKSIEIL